MRALDGGQLELHREIALPPGLELPTSPPSRDRLRAGLYAFGLAPDGRHVVALGAVEGEGVLVTLDSDGEVRRTRLDGGRAVAFDRTGTRVWIVTENERGRGLLLVDPSSHARLGELPCSALLTDAVHELHPHAIDNAVLYAASTGEATFAHVAGWSDGPPEFVATALDGGGVAASFIGFSRDGARAHFVEQDELRTHAWPNLHELSSVPFVDEFTSTFGGAVLGDCLYVDGLHVDDERDAVMLFDRSAIVGALLRPPSPAGMWAGRMGADVIVTVDPSPVDESGRRRATARAYRIPASTS